MSKAEFLTMEKAVAPKKEQEVNKKGKQQKKKKNQVNWLISPKKNNQNFLRSKKNKKIRNNDGKQPSKEKPGPSFAWFAFINVVVLVIAIGFLYVVDYQKFTQVRLVASASVNKTLSFLPPALVTKGKNAFELVRPFTEIVFDKLNVIIGKGSTFLNTNPLVRDHWVNVLEISSVCCGHLVEYLRTLYLLTSSCCNEIKNKLFP